MGDRPDMRSLIDELGAAALDCRELLADVRTATKDLRLAVREAQEARDELAEAVHKMVGDDVEEAVRAHVEKLGTATKVAMDDAVERVSEKFVELTNLMMTGARRAGAGGLDLRQLAAGVATQARGDAIVDSYRQRREP